MNIDRLAGSGKGVPLLLTMSNVALGIQRNGFRQVENEAELIQQPEEN